MKYCAPFVFSCSLIIITPGQAGTADPQDLELAYQYLNQLRDKADMTPLARHPLLEQAAQNHANYLDQYRLTGHYETEGVSGFTGVHAKNRAVNAGYRSLNIGENVSTVLGRNNSSFQSIDNLMSAIYHRFGFLDFVYNEVGIGIAETAEGNNKRSSYVYNLGNSDYNALCQNPPTPVNKYYYNICQPDVQVDATAYDNATAKTQGHNPTIVMWPANNSSDIPPAFFEEDPDPLPDYQVSGYPISIQFNSLTFPQVIVSDFKLYRDNDNQEVKLTRLLTPTNDPNKQFSSGQFALFPLERLMWNTGYRAEVTYTDTSGTKTQIWRFRTRDLNMPIYTTPGKGETLSVPVNVSPFAVYIPPNTNLLSMNGFNTRFPAGLQLDTQFIDANTLSVYLQEGQVGQQVTFNLSGNGGTKSGKFIVEISDSLGNNQTTMDDLPVLGTANAFGLLQGLLNTTAQMAGGIRLNAGSYQTKVTQQLTDTVEIKGIIQVDPSHVGQKADIFVYAESTLPPSPEVYYFMLGEGLTIDLWDQNPGHLIAFNPSVTLNKTHTVAMYSGRFYYPGTLKVYFGYRTADNVFVVSNQPIDIAIR